MHFAELHEAASSGTWPVPLDAAEHWIRDFIAHPHAALPSGLLVCPYALGALDRGRIFATHLAIDPDYAADKRPYCAAALRRIAESFATFTADDRFWSCVLVTITGVAAHEYRHVLNGAYRDVKEPLLRARLMVGAFHPLSNRTSRRTSALYPLRAPLPFFALRHLLPEDAASLAESEAFLAIHREHFPAVAK